MTYKEQIKHPKWQKKRLEILKRDDFTCQFCKSKNKTLHIHHLCYMPNTKVWEYDNELMITLCDEHHDDVHEMNKIFAIIVKDWIIFKYDIL